MSFIENLILNIFVSILWWIASVLLDDNVVVKSLLVKAFVSGFAWYLVFLFCLEKEFSMNVTGIFCWVAWLSWDWILTILKNFANKYLQQKTDAILKNKKKDDD